MNGFSFHPKCQSINLSQLAFADDLLFIICGADQPTFLAIIQMFDEFYHFSGLRRNLHKSSIFFPDSEEYSPCSSRVITS